MHKKGRTSIIDPKQIADETMVGLPADLIRMAAVFQLRQIAREVLRRYHNGKGTSSKKPRFADPEAPTFPGEDFGLLQERYPRAHTKDDEERGYVLRDDMTQQDWEWNIAQLDGESGVKHKHARQLERWGELKGFARGKEAI